ncbi:hypothetical protein GF336_07770 [Candidatus Woesearchaeota archaeon]|nr:hypothetical protein [Candidatus Woesearchaeota archaeon]
MGLTTQRILIITVMINILLFSGTAMYNNTAYSHQDVSNELDQMGAHSKFFRDDFGDTPSDSEDQLNADSFGDEKGGQMTLWSLFVDGMRKIPSRNEDGTFEKIITSIMNLIRSMFALLLGLELVLVLKNRKGT